MNLSKAHIIQLIATAILVFLLYTLFHEMGHGVVGIISGGTIDRLILGPNARIYMSGAAYNSFTLPLMNVMGVLLPYLIFSVVTLLYNNKSLSFFYQMFHALYVYIILGSLLPWIAIPLSGYFRSLPPEDDVTNFLTSSGIPPYLVTLTGLTLFVLFYWQAYRKGIIRSFIRTLKADHI